MRKLALAVVLLVPTMAQAEIGLDTRRMALTLTGTIGGLDHCVAAEILTHHPAIATVIIDSPGGDAWAGAQLARLFGHAGLTAVVPPGGRALSAAGMAALGAPRLILAGRLGLHAPYATRPEAPLAMLTTAQTRDEMRTVLEEAGLPAPQIRAALATPPRDMLMLSAAALALRPHRIAADRAPILRLHAACAALVDLHGGPGRRPT